MNTENDEFDRIEREQKMRGVPDAIHHTDTSETLEYIQGWNDCRQAMLAAQRREHMSKILIDEATVTLLLEALEGLKSIPGGRHELHELNAIHRKHERAITALKALAEQPAQQEPVFCEHCGGNDEDPQDHCMDCTRPRWEAVTQELLNNQHPWLYEPMWISTKGGAVIQGHYEWRQGRNPDRFITDDGDDWAFDFAYIMPIVKPTPPAIEAKLKEKNNG